MGSEGGSAEKAFRGMAEGAPNRSGEPPTPSRGSPRRPALAHVYGIEDPFRELLQLVRGILGLLLQPQVVLPEVLDFRLQVGFVFLFLGGRAEEERAGTQQLEGWLGSRCPLHPFLFFILNLCICGLTLGIRILRPEAQ